MVPIESLDLDVRVTGRMTYRTGDLLAPVLYDREALATAPFRGGSESNPFRAPAMSLPSSIGTTLPHREIRRRQRRGRREL